MTPDAWSRARAELPVPNRVRVAINYGNPALVRLDAVTGEPAGLAADLAHELARALGVPAEFVTYRRAGRVIAAVAPGEWDVAFLAIDPERARQVLFTEPYAQIEASYLVRAGAPFERCTDLDRPGRRIAAVSGSAYDLFLARHLQHATLTHAASSSEVAALLATGLDAAAGIRPALDALARDHPEWRVLPDSFTTIEQAICTPAGRPAMAAGLAAFIGELRASGDLARLLKPYREHGLTPLAPER